MKMYKIRNKKTGLYSSGTMYPIFKKVGKTWKSKQALSLHFTWLKEYNNFYKDIDDLEVIEYIVSENRIIPLGDYK